MAYCRRCIHLNHIFVDGVVDCRYYTASYGSTIMDHKDCDFFLDLSKLVKNTLKETAKADSSPVSPESSQIPSSSPKTDSKPE